MEIDTINPTLEISSESGEFGFETPKITTNKNHAKMNNLDYENSGHTGFASSKDIESINNELLNKANKNEIPDTSQFVKDNNYVHTDNNYTDEDKSKLDELENFTGNSSDVSYGDTNVQEALDEAFETIEQKASISDMTNYIEEHKEEFNGISATHSWNGTTLTITSASGTSSADLKGSKGDTGEAGKDGTNGADGYTPVKGTDYYTEADKKEIVELVLAEIPSSEGVSY